MKHLLAHIRRPDFYSAGLHLRCIARKLRAGQPLGWHLAGLRRAFRS